MMSYNTHKSASFWGKNKVLSFLRTKSLNLHFEPKMLRLKYSFNVTKYYKPDRVCWFYRSLSQFYLIYQATEFKFDIGMQTCWEQTKSFHFKLFCLHRHKIFAIKYDHVIHNGCDDTDCWSHMFCMGCRESKFMYICAAQRREKAAWSVLELHL